jgi:hypothetical protein
MFTYHTRLYKVHEVLTQENIRFTHEFLEWYTTYSWIYSNIDNAATVYNCWLIQNAFNYYSYDASKMWKTP